MYDFKIALVEKLKEFIDEDKIFNTLPLNDDDNEPEYPFIVYSVLEIDNLPRIDYDVKIDVWDNNSNTIILEQLSDSIANGLNRISYSTDDITFRSYKSNVQDVETQEEELNRRQIQTFFFAYTK